MINYLIFGPIAVSALYVAYVTNWLRGKSSGNEKMVFISKAIQAGSAAFLKREYYSIVYVAAAIFVVIGFSLGWLMAAGFVVGAFTSALAGYVGMNVAVRSNAKLAEAARHGLGPSLSLAFRAGSVTGFLVVTLGLLAVSVFFFLTHDIKALIGLGFGASLISVFARLGGGIFTKAADVGTDSVGKTEAGIPEDDPRNPGVIAGLVGDNVGDCAGTAADLFETYAVTIIVSLLLGRAAGFSGAALVFPLVLGGLAILASVLGGFFVRLGKGENIMGAIYKGLAATIVIAAVLFYFAVKAYFPFAVWPVFGSALAGLLVMILMVLITDYYTAKKFRPVKSIAEASKSGHGTNIIVGLSMGMESTFAPIIVIAGGILVAYSLYGFYGIAVAATSMLSVAGMVMAIDSFGPIADNASGIAEMSGAPAETRKTTDALDAVGNTTKAVTKGYAIASAGLAALVLFSGYSQELLDAGKAAVFELQNPAVLIGLLLGAALPYLFASIAMRSVGKTAEVVVHEIRRQFREIKGLITGEVKPEYDRAVDIVTKAALREMVLPALLPVVFVVIVGFVLGAAALGGFLMGTIVSGLFLAISMTSGGAAWDNAKKYIESAPAADGFGSRDSDAHKAAVTGDTVGDPYKDTAGPAINPMIKVASIVALLLVPFL